MELVGTINGDTCMAPKWVKSKDPRSGDGSEKTQVGFSIRCTAKLPSQPLSPKLLLVPRQAKPIFDLVRLQLLQRLGQIPLVNLDLLHPRLDSLLRRQLQHLQRLPPAPQMRAPKEATIAQERLVPDLDPIPLRQAHAHPFGMNVQQAQIRVQVEPLEAARRIDNQIKGHDMLLIPPLLRRRQEAIRPHRHRIPLLRPRPANHPDLGPQRLGKQQPKMPNPPQADDAHLLPGPASVPHERRIRRQPSAEHRRRRRGGQRLGDGKDPVLVGAHVRRVAALRDDARVGPDGAVRVKLLEAVGLVVVAALAAVEAGPALGANADALAGLDEGDFGADAKCGADDFCTGMGC